MTMQGSAQPAPSLATAAQGARCWIISDGKAGHVAITVGVAEAMRLDYRLIPVCPRGLRRLFAPWAPVSPAKWPGRETSPFNPPWPDFVFAAGRTTIPYLRAVRREAGGAVFAVAFQDPRTGIGTADVIWAPEHDRLRGPNVVTTPTAPHRFSAARLAALRASLPEEIEALPKPRIAVMLGGPSGAYRFSESDVSRLRKLLESAARLGASFMITRSRRTPPAVLAQAAASLGDAPHLIWDGKGENQYPNYLAAADMLIVTADSVNMTGEATATGKPVYVFAPSGGRPKFARFHQSLRACGAARPAPEAFERFEAWNYEAINAAAVVAGEIAARWLARRAVRARIVGGDASV